MLGDGMGIGSIGDVTGSRKSGLPKLTPAPQALAIISCNQKSHAVKHLMADYSTSYSKCSLPLTGSVSSSDEKVDTLGASVDYDLARLIKDPMSYIIGSMTSPTLLSDDAIS